MTLKVQIKGVKTEITAPARPLITFINGQKKRLIRGVTFINGQKKVLWNISGLKIDYINGIAGLIEYNFKPVCVNKNKLIITGTSYSTYGNQVSRIDISNLTNPVLENTVLNGNIVSYSTPDSTINNNVFYSIVFESTESKKFNQINITNDMVVTVNSSYNYQRSGYATYCIKVYDGWLAMTAQNMGTGLGSTVSQISHNGNVVYSWTSRGSNVVRATSPTLIKKDESSGAGIYHSYQSETNGIGIYSSTNYSSVVSGVDYKDVIIDKYKNYFCGGEQGVALYNDLGTKIFYFAPRNTNRMCQIIGIIGNYYYVVDCPKVQTDWDTSGVYLDIYDRYGELKDTKKLNLPDPTNGSGGLTSTPYYYIYCIPQVSSTGYLAFSWASDPITSTNKILVRITGY